MNEASVLFTRCKSGLPVCPNGFGMILRFYKSGNRQVRVTLQHGYCHEIGDPMRSYV